MDGRLVGSLERVREAGCTAATTVDLLAVAFARREADVSIEVGRELAKRYEPLSRLAEAGAAEVRELTGLEPFESLRNQALLELGRRAAGGGRGDPESIGSPEEVAARLAYLRREKQEHFVAVLLDAKNNILKVSTIHIGTLTMSVVGPREVFREAVREGASSVVLAHNHPSGDPTPSPEDIEVTARLVEVGRALDIPVHDHVIIGDPDWVSLRTRGLMS